MQDLNQKFTSENDHQTEYMLLNTSLLPRINNWSEIVSPSADSRSGVRMNAN